MKINQKCIMKTIKGNYVSVRIGEILVRYQLNFTKDRK